VTRVNEPEFQLWLEWEHFESWDNDNSDDDFFNTEVRLPGGRSYGSNVWPYGMLKRARRADGKTGQHLGGAYLLPPDLFVARRDRSLLEAVVRDILRTGVPESWRLEVAVDVE
jgi:hypothetical protein